MAETPIFREPIIGEQSLFPPPHPEAKRYRLIARCPVTDQEIDTGVTISVDPGSQLPDPLPYQNARLQPCPHCTDEHDVALEARLDG